MDRLRLIFLFLVFLFFLPNLSAASDIVGDNFEEISGRGLVIRTNPPGVRVFIDGVDRGLTPVTLENTGFGEHQIRLTREGYRERRFNVTLSNNSRLVVSIEMEELRGIALVSVHKAGGSPDNLPFNPQIFSSALDETVSGISLSHDNTVLLNLPVGYHTIRSRAFGWEDTAVTILVNENVNAAVNIFMRPALFRIENGTQSRRRFNPANPNNLGNTEYRFHVSAPGTGAITILNRNGSVVFSRQLNYFDTWVQNVSWNGRDSYGNPLPDGIYTVLIEASPISEFIQGPAQTVQLTMETEINHAINIFPLSLRGGISGLTFTPMPSVLPPGSFQVEAGVLYGRFNISSSDMEDGIFSGFPFGFGIRVATFNRLEAAAGFNINPLINNSTGWGLSGSLKYNIPQNNLPVDLAIGASYSWSNKNGEDPLSPGSGIGLYMPFSLELEMFSVIFSPSVFWRGPDGIVPSILLSAGILHHSSSWINTGLSLRSEFDFWEDSRPKFLAGLEGRFYPPPSYLFFLVQAGLWTHNSLIGGYAGLGIGVIY
jgi:hypothetical protein